MEEGIETARQLMMGLLEKMEINAELDGSLMGRDIYLEVRGDQQGILIGRQPYLGLSPISYQPNGQ